MLILLMVRPIFNNILIPFKKLAKMTNKAKIKVRKRGRERERESRRLIYRLSFTIRLCHIIYHIDPICLLSRGIKTEDR